MNSINPHSGERSTPNFNTFKFDQRILDGVIAAGYTAPTPIQEQTIPAIIQGRDLLGLAQTGTGKTAAFVLPMLQRLADDPNRGLRAVIIAPTRELVDQIQANIRVLGAKLNIWSATIYGGVPMGPQVRNIRRGLDIIVACPGRLLDHIEQRTINLSTVDFLVLDEADQMFDMGFLPTISKILKTLPQKRQTLLFSATMPKDVQHLANEAMTNPVKVRAGNEAPVETVSHFLCRTQQENKTSILLGLLKQTETKSVLVFTRTKHRAKRVADQLYRSGYKCTSLQGNLSQGRRKQAMEGFRNGKFQILVATDIAARGIDVSQVSHVVNFDIPGTPDAYTHRIGRTGRAARTGEAVTFVTREDSSMVRAIERLLGYKIPEREVQGVKIEHKMENREDRDDRPFERQPQRNGHGHGGNRNRRRSDDRDDRQPFHSERRRRQDRQRTFSSGR